MKKKLSLILLLILVITAISLSVVACKTPKEPVYQGMTIERLHYTYASTNSADVLYGNNGNGIGWGCGNEGKHPDNGEFVPADGNELDTDIKDIVTIVVQGDDTVKYYVRPNETFIVQIHISNPDYYEIQSFTLNGQKYANYMFRQGSTMELLLLEVTAPSTSGYVDYTIDAIKYIDGTEIKDVRMDGSKTIKAGIAYTSEPTATLTSQNIETTRATFNYNVTDNDGIIGKNAITAYLTDGETKVAEKALKVGSNTVTFDNLAMGKTYQYGIAATYDLVDGRGEQAHWLTNGNFTTTKAFAVTAGQATQTGVRFNIEKTGSVGNTTAVKLVDVATNQTVATLSKGTDDYSYNDLLSNHTYAIVVEFEYPQNGNTVKDATTTKFKTLAKTAPTVTVNNVTSTQTAIGFELSTTDVDNILSIAKIELYKGTNLIKTAQRVTAREFADLLSNNEYTVKVTYTYDLNDGEGVHTQTATASKRTVAKTAPTVTVNNVTSTQTSIGFELSTTDVDNILSIAKIELYKGTNLVKTANSVTEREFADLLSNNEYEIRVTYTYDLNDGEGVHTQTATASKHTVAKTAPTVAVENVTSTQTSIGFELATTDVDDILNIDKVELFNGETLEKTLDKTASTFNVDNLTSGTMYTVKVSYCYNLNDGNGAHNQVVTLNYPTLVESISVSEVSLVNNSQIKLGEELNLRLSFNNPNKVELKNIYVNGIKAQVAGGDRKTYAIVKFTPDEAGLIDFYVDRVDYDFSGVLVNQEVDSLAHVTFPVFNDLSVNFEPVSANPYRYTGQGIYLTFDNPHNYKVYKINGSTDFVKISDNEFYFGILPDLGKETFTIESIEYGYDNYGATTQAFTYSLNIYAPEFYRPVYTAEDFIGMVERGYYILMNDLDLRTVSITQTIKFTHLNGNGHTIRGLHNVIDSASQNYYDIFDKWTPKSIFDVNFTEMYFSYVNNKIEQIEVSLLGNVDLYNCSLQGDLCISGNIKLLEMYVDGYYDDDGNWVDGYYKQDLISQYNGSNTFDLILMIDGDFVTDIKQQGVKLPNNDKLEIENGLLYYNLNGSAYILVGCYDKAMTEVVIREGTLAISNRAFGNCSNLTNITIPDSVVLIQGQPNFDSPFSDCNNLANINYLGTIEDWLKISGLDYLMEYGAIGKKLLFNGEELTGELVIPNTVTSIPSYAFIYTNITSVAFEENSQCASIGYLAFYNCRKLQSVILPNSITSIDEAAFSPWYLKVYYNGAAEEWNQIGYDLNGLATLYYYSETEPELNADGTVYNGNYWHYDDNNEIVVWTYKKEN